jgi:hypothetical protein
MSTITLRATKGSPLTNTEVDGNFTNLNNDKYQSADSPSFTNLTLTGTQTNSIAAAVSAAGANQGAATALTKTVNIVTSITASTADGVALPSAAAGLYATVINTTATALKIYPASGDAINALSVNALFTLPAYTSIQLYAKDATTWYTQTPLVVYDSSGTRLN